MTYKTVIDEETGKKYVPIKDLCNNLKIDPWSQIKKIRNNPEIQNKKLWIKHSNGKTFLYNCILESDIELFKSKVDWKLVESKKKSKRYTYILWDGKSDFIKIGSTNDPMRRLKQHQNSTKTLQIIHLIEGDHEKHFKEKYKHLWIDFNTEHYWLTKELMEAWEQFEDVNHKFF